MACNDLRQFLNTLEEFGELHRVPVEVDPVLEIAEITRRVCGFEGGGKALLFEKVRGSRIPVATNMFGSIRRVCAALGIVDLQDLRCRMEDLLQRHGTPSLTGALFQAFRPIEVDSAPCQELDEADAAAVFSSALKGWPEDGKGSVSGGRFLTLPLVFTSDPATGTQNCGLYRVEAFSGSTCGIHWYPGSGGRAHHEAYAAAGRPTPVAIALGGDPAITLAAAMPLPHSVNEADFAGFLRQSPLSEIRSGTNGLMIPATAEIVIEGIIEPGEAAPGGLFGNHTGYYRPGDDVSLVRILRVMRRRDAILPATVVGPPPMEDFFLGKAIERLMLPVLRAVVPEIVDINLFREGMFHGAAIVAVSNTSPGLGRLVIDTLWSGGWLASSRLLVVVDEEVSPHDVSRAAWWTLNHVDWMEDVITAEWPAPPGLPFSGRLAIDATRKRASWGPKEVVPDASIRDLVTAKWRDYGFDSRRHND